MAIDKSIKLPQKFCEQYRKNIGMRISSAIVLLSAAGSLCAAIDFSETRYPVMGVDMVMACGFVLACLIARVHWILFRKSWSGTITDIDIGYKTKTKERGFTRRLAVTLTVDTGEKKQRRIELLPKQYTKENLFQIHAPYKPGDTVVYLRGMKYPFRYDVDEARDEMFDGMFVCPYCGDINKAERDTCYTCGKILIK